MTTGSGPAGAVPAGTAAGGGATAGTAMAGTLAGGAATAGTLAGGAATAGTAQPRTDAGGPVAPGPTADRSRRAVLAATVASLPLLAVTGCKSVGALAAPPRPAPEVALLRAAIAAEELMIARYDAVITRSPRLAAGLRPLRTEHRLHLAGLRSRLVVPPGSAAAAAASPAPASSRSSPGASDAPAGAAAAISFLQGAERAAAADLLRKLTAVSPSLAQLMASVAASEATHVAALAAARGNGRT